MEQQPDMHDTGLPEGRQWVSRQTPKALIWPLVVGVAAVCTATVLLGPLSEWLAGR